MTSNSLLRTVLSIDALTCVAAGLLMSAGASLLSEPLGLSVTLLRAAGLSLLPFAAYLASLARRAEPSARAVWIAIACNVLWVIDSALLLTFGWAQPTALGYAFVIAQALAVAVLSELEFVGLKRSVSALELVQ